MTRLVSMIISLSLAVISVSIGAALYIGARFSPAEAIAATFAIFLVLFLIQNRADKKRDQVAIVSQIEDLHRQVSVLDHDMQSVFTRLKQMEMSSLSAQSANLQESVEPIEAELQAMGALVRNLAEAVAILETSSTASRPNGMMGQQAMLREPAGPASVTPMPQHAAGLPAGGTPAPVQMATHSEPDAAMRERAMPVPGGASADPSEMSEIAEAMRRLQAQPGTTAQIAPTLTADPAEALQAGAMQGDSWSPEERLHVRETIGTRNVDLYLQPIVTLPQRKVRFYEALSRIKGLNGDVLEAEDFLPIARQTRQMPIVDTLALDRSVQIVRRLSTRNRDIGIFCNLSIQSLAETATFDRIYDMLQANQALGRSLILEMSQQTVRSLGPIENEALGAIAELGFRFSMDQVSDLRTDFRELSMRGFRYLKIHAQHLLTATDPGHGLDIHPADLSDLLARYGMDLIVDHIEDEASVIELLDYDAHYGQGHLFSGPRPVRADILGSGSSGPVAAQ